MKKRIGLLLTVAAVMVAVLALSPATASAVPQCTTTPNAPSPGKFTVRCVETVVTTETVTTPAVQACEVGSSGRQGTQAGTLTQTFQVTTTTTTTTVFQGNPQAGNVASGPTTTTDVQRVLTSSVFTPTGNCRNIPGPQ